MRLLKSASDLKQVRGLLTRLLSPLALDRNFDLKSDLLYFDTIYQANLASLPRILRGTNETRCFIFHYASLIASPASSSKNGVIEILAEDSGESIVKQLSNSAPDHDEFLSVFHLTGLFGIIPESLDWVLLAQTDDFARLYSSHERKYSKFLSIWWEFCEQNRVPLDA